MICPDNGSWLLNKLLTRIGQIKISNYIFHLRNLTKKKEYVQRQLFKRRRLVLFKILIWLRLDKKYVNMGLDVKQRTKKKSQRLCILWCLNVVTFNISMTYLRPCLDCIILRTKTYSSKTLVLRFHLGPTY